MRLTNVVFPLPRNPVTMVTGVFMLRCVMIAVACYRTDQSRTRVHTRTQTPSIDRAHAQKLLRHLLDAARRRVFSAILRRRPCSSHHAMPLEMKKVTTIRHTIPAAVHRMHTNTDEHHLASAE